MSKYSFIVVLFSLLLVNCLGDGDSEKSSAPAGGASGSGGSSTGGSTSAGGAGGSGTGGSSATGGYAGSGATDGGCVPGKAEECACPGGAKGTKTCKSDGTFGSCECLPCEPGKAYECFCPGGAKSTQTCAADGQSLGKCGCDSGTGGTGGSEDMKVVNIKFTLPNVVPGLTGVKVGGISNDNGTDWGQWVSLCDSSTITPEEKFIQDGNTFTCSRTVPNRDLDINVLVLGQNGQTLFPSGSSNQDACYGPCTDGSCWEDYGITEADGQVLTVKENAVWNNLTVGGCNYRVKK